MWVFRKLWEFAKNIHVRHLQKLILAIELNHCECCTPWPWPTFSRSNFSSGYNLDIQMLEKGERYHCHWIGSHVFAIEWRHCKFCISLPWPPTFASTRMVPPWSCSRFLQRRGFDSSEFCRISKPIHHFVIFFSFHFNILICLCNTECSWRLGFIIIHIHVRLFHLPLAHLKQNTVTRVGRLWGCSTCHWHI